MKKTDFKTVITGSAFFKAMPIFNTKELNEKISLYFDIYQMVTSEGVISEMTFADFTPIDFKYGKIASDKFRVDTLVSGCYLAESGAIGTFKFTIEANFRALLELIQGEKTKIQPDGKLIETLVLEPCDLVNLGKAAKFCGSDDLRLNMTGVFLGDKGRGTEIVATDANKLYFAPATFECKSGFIIPKNEAAILAKQKSPVVLSFYEIERTDKSTYVQFVADFQGGQITGYCINERFPDYPCVIPSDLQFFEIPISDFAKALKSVLHTASRTTHRVVLSENQGCISLHSHDIEMNQETTLQTEIQTLPGLKIGFNGKFLLSTLQSFKDKTVKIGYQAYNRAVIFEGMDSKALLMPFVQIN